MLLDPGLASQNGNGEAVLDKTISALFASIRETDIAGWYKEHSLLGVIFAELGPVDKKSVVAALHTKITAALRPSWT